MARSWDASTTNCLVVLIFSIFKIILVHALELNVYRSSLAMVIELDIFNCGLVVALALSAAMTNFTFVLDLNIFTTDVIMAPNLSVYTANVAVGLGLNVVTSRLVLLSAQTLGLVKFPFALLNLFTRGFQYTAVLLVYAFSRLCGAA
jgi:hypothetical protein